MWRSKQKQFFRPDYRNYVEAKLVMPRHMNKYIKTQESITIGILANYLHIRPKTLISIFDYAGIHSLTPNHIINTSQIEELIAHLRNKQSSTNELYADQGTIEPKIIIVQSINSQLMKQIATRPNLLYQLEPRRFEELIAKLLEDLGCDVRLTKNTRDGGYDIFGSMKTSLTEIIFLAECKRYSPENKVGVELVRNLYGVTELHKANLGLLITSSTFTVDAHQEKIRIGSRISLKDYEDLKIWLSSYQKKV